MEALDGNSIAGALFEYFGQEMTAAWGTCAHCGTPAQIAELRVYSRAPGTVVRCPTCGQVDMVVVTVGESSRIDYRYFHLRHQPVGRPLGC